MRNLPRNVPEFQIRDFFNSLSSGQVENILRTAGYVLITFLSPEAAKTVMEVGGALEVGGARDFPTSQAGSLQWVSLQ